MVKIYRLFFILFLWGFFLFTFSPLKPCINFSLDIGIELILGRLIPVGHIADPRTPPRWLPIFVLLFLLFHLPEIVSLLTLVKVLIELLRYFEHLIILILLHYVLTWEYPSVATKEFLFHDVPLVVYFFTLGLLFVGGKFLHFASEDSFLELLL